MGKTGLDEGESVRRDAVNIAGDSEAAHGRRISAMGHLTRGAGLRDKIG
jgi:hypothetical protein